MTEYHCEKCGALLNISVIESELASERARKGKGVRKNITEEERKRRSDKITKYNKDRKTQ